MLSEAGTSSTTHINPVPWRVEMTKQVQDTIAINAITRAINTMVEAGIAYDAACNEVRKLRATDKLSVADARTYIQAALLSKKPEYRKQVTERGYPAQDSAYAKAVTRLMKDTAPETSAQSKPVRVPAALREAIEREDARHAKVMKALRDQYGSEAVSAARKGK